MFSVPQGLKYFNIKAGRMKKKNFTLTHSSESEELYFLKENQRLIEQIHKKETQKKEMSLDNTIPLFSSENLQDKETLKKAS